MRMLPVLISIMIMGKNVFCEPGFFHNAFAALREIQQGPISCKTAKPPSQDIGLLQLCRTSGL
jgi:hypothetical protein